MPPPLYSRAMSIFLKLNGREVFNGTVRPLFVVGHPPLLQFLVQGLQRTEPLQVQAFGSRGSVQSFNNAVLGWLPGLDVAISIRFFSAPLAPGSPPPSTAPKRLKTIPYMPCVRATVSSRASYPSDYARRTSKTAVVSANNRRVTKAVKHIRSRFLTHIHRSNFSN
jgi:hypothetical protein